MVEKQKGKSIGGTIVPRRHPKIDLNKSRRAAQNAMDKVRKRRIHRKPRTIRLRRTSAMTGRRSV